MHAEKNSFCCKSIGADSSQRRKRNIAEKKHTVTLGVQAELQEFDFMPNGVFDNETGGGTTFIKKHKSSTVTALYRPLHFPTT